MTDAGTGPRGVRRHEPPCRALRFPPRKAPDLSRVPPAGRATKGERVGGVALRAGRGRPAADLMPRAATPWPPGRLRSPARPAPHAPVQVSLRAPGRPPGPGSRLAGRWKVPGGPLRDSPRVVQVALSQCGRCRPSWGREAATSRGPRPAERGRGETPAPLIGAHRRGCTRGGATARLALRGVPQRGPRGAHGASSSAPRAV